MGNCLSAPIYESDCATLVSITHLQFNWKKFQHHPSFYNQQPKYINSIIKYPKRRRTGQLYSAKSTIIEYIQGRKGKLALTPLQYEYYWKIVISD
jgi:hypothetical protein